MSSESLMTCKTSKWAGGAARRRMGTHSREPQPEHRTIYKEFLLAVRAPPQKTERCLLEKDLNSEQEGSYSTEASGGAKCVRPGVQKHFGKVC